MRPVASVYLTGPDIHYPEARALAVEKVAICEEAGFIGVSAMEHLLVETEPSEIMAREIYAATILQLRAADALIANLTPFRGPYAEPGAVFETGFMAGLGKPVFAYMNVETEEEADHCTRVIERVGGEADADGLWRDLDGAVVEDFGLPETLMLWAEARRFYVIVTNDVQGDLTGLRLCLDALQLYAE